jgi:prolyl-tRNA synthetase
MRYSQLFIPTRREDPSEAEVVSHKLLVRAGYLRMLARGIYTYLPLAWRTLRKIEEVIRQEMDRAGAQEVLMPSVQPSELWEESGRWAMYGPELLRFQDRKGANFCLGPTHEEVITSLVRGEVRSYKQLPVNLYQIQTKFRDEIRPRAGLMRGREFIMKDAYSFDVDEAGAKRSYQAMYEAYCRIFRRMGLQFMAVDADTGSIGGSMSHEFQVLAQSGEDEIVACPAAGYAANVEKAQVLAPEGVTEETAGALEGELSALEAVSTPGMRTVEEVTAYLGVGAEALAKTLLFVVDEALVAVMVRGDREANEIKVKALLGGSQVRLATEAEVREATGAPVGFAGPVGLGVPVLADWSLARRKDLVVGGNQADVHYRGANVGRDFTVSRWGDLSMARAGDPCPIGGGVLESYRGIEVGHVFFLGTKYSQPMGAVVQDEKGDVWPMVMGCYGIGVTRVMAAVIEQHHDGDGIRWPMPVAPYQVLITTIGKQEEALMEAAQRLHDELEALGVEVVLDDRDERPPVKFKDADLIGIPLRLTLGARGLKEGVVEVKWRHESGFVQVGLGEAASVVSGMVKAALAVG